jgi:murein DD-endopeptidase MepM/ murein hydrolase activator NlpD
MPQTRRRGNRRHPLIRHAYLPIALVLSLVLSSIAAADSRAEDFSHRSVTTVAVVLKPGGSFHQAVLQSGVSPRDALAAEHAIADLYDLHRLRPGQAIMLSLGPKAGADGRRILLAVHIEAARGADLTVVRSEDGRFQSDGTAAATPLAVHQQTVVVTTGLRESLAAAHIPAGVAAEIGKAAIFDPDFPEKPKAGARLTIVYETFGRSPDDAAGAVLRYASLDDGRKRHEVYRYALADSLVAFLTENGLGAAALSLADPVANARVTSGFGWRVHPVLGVWKFHNGVDYAAPRGTPVHVAADGVVEDIGWHGANGFYVRVRHGQQLETTYSHLQRFATNIRRGTQLHKGQVIAYVGMTGLATGPHLYYEILVDGRPVDPQKDDLAVPVTLTSEDLAKFRKFVQTAAVPK